MIVFAMLQRPNDPIPFPHPSRITHTSHHRRGRSWAFVAGGVLSAASFYSGILWQQGADLPPVTEGSEAITIATPMLDAIFQNTPGQSEGYARGVPKGFAWCSGSSKTGNPPPSNFTAVTG